jgi:hypothetical protein
LTGKKSKYSVPIGICGQMISSPRVSFGTFENTYEDLSSSSESRGHNRRSLILFPIEGVIDRSHKLLPIDHESPPARFLSPTDYPILNIFVGHHCQNFPVGHPSETVSHFPLNRDLPPAIRY